MTFSHPLNHPLPIPLFISASLCSADEHGGVTLKAFLDSEATLLPKLSKLRLLS
jgi:hypothetical protein